MSVALRNRLRKAENQLRLLKGSVPTAAELACQAALQTLSDDELLVLRGGQPGQADVPASEVEKEIRRRARNKLERMFPDQGPLRRELYPKQLEFFRAGRDHRERAFIAGNRCGKSEAGAYETALHLTGRYPHWWEAGASPSRSMFAWHRIRAGPRWTFCKPSCWVRSCMGPRIRWNSLPAWARA